jgi:DNA-directed RNA polymerase subunit RPC12/RpoP
LQTQNWRAAIEYVSSGVLSTTHFALLNTLDKKGLSNVIEEYKCSSCGALHTVSVTPIGTRHRFCPRCVERHTRHSVVQGGRIMRDRSVSFVPSVASWRAGEYDYCTADYAIAERFVRVYMPSAGQDHYVTPALRDELVLHGYIERPKVIGAYHSSKAVVNNFIGNDAAAPFLGMELEVETRSQSDSDAEAKATVLLGKMQSHDFGGKKYTYCNTERDGSLSAGFEIVTAPCTLDVHAEKLKQLATVIEGLQSHPTTTCGLHVHIDRKGTSPLQRGKMVMFINSPKNRTLIEAVARRYNVDHYAKILSKRLTNGTHDSPDRYEAVNLTNRHTIEFRIFKGTLRYESIMACLEFTRAVWFFTRHAGFNDLYEKQFVEWVNRPENRGDTPNLRQVLFEKGLLTGRPPLRETTPAPAGEK